MTHTTASTSHDLLDVPFTTFVLDNGLTVHVVHNPAVPQVSFNLWYQVGAKDEPPGKTGFAHLFEHLMFAGSRNLPGPFFSNMADIGATGVNGTTTYDRTNYYETVHVGALDYLLYAESDRMGHFYETINQEALDLQRGVVLNEKAEYEGENGDAAERQARACYPLGHPYAHSVLGERADLRSATLEDVRQWFKRYYVPNNAVITLVGDIDVGSVQEKVERYFADIPPGSPIARPPASYPPIPRGTRHIEEDRSAGANLQMVWNLPPIGNIHTDQLQLAANILAVGMSSRLSRRAVYSEQLALFVHAKLDAGMIASQFTLFAAGKPGQPLDRLEQVVEEELQKLISEGPEEGELALAKTELIAAFINDHETNASIAELISSSHVLRGSPDGYKDFLSNLESATATSIRTAMRLWLTDERYTRITLPFTATSGDAAGIDRSAPPAITPPSPARFPALQHATLANGLRIALIERHGPPLACLRLSVRLGTAQDTTHTLGLTQLVRRMLTQGGAGERNHFEFYDAVKALGASIEVDGNKDHTFIELRSLSSNLIPALDLFADQILRPQLDASALDTTREHMMTGINQAAFDMESAIERVLPGLIYPPGHPYSRPEGINGTHRTLKALTFEQATAHHAEWFRPEMATLLVVGDTTLEKILPELEQRFADWAPTNKIPPTIEAVAPPRHERIYAIHVPGVEQSTITVVSAIPGSGWESEAAFSVLHDIVGHSFSSRLNMNLREDKNWTYGVQGIVSHSLGPRFMGFETQVQADKTAAAAELIRSELRELITTRPITSRELAIAKNAQLLNLGAMASSLQHLASRGNHLLRHDYPDDYWHLYGEQIQRLTLDDMLEIAENVIRPEQLTWVIAGDLSVIGKQLEELGDVQQIEGTGEHLYDDPSA